MRQAFRDVDWIEDEGKIVGICLGYDYCAEHEWGIKGIKQTLGIWSGDPKTEKKVFGFERHRVTTGEKVRWLETTVKKKKFYGITTYKGWRTDEESLKYLKNFIPSYKSDSELLTAWNEDAFIIWTTDKEKLKIIFDAFQQNKILYGFHSDKNPFSGSGLIFMLPDNGFNEKEIIKEQKAYIDMHQRVEKTGIHNTLKKAGCRYFALRPEQKEDWRGLEKSKLKDIKFWLNPMEQGRNNSGWFSLEELKQWAKGKGPVLKDE